MVMSEILGVKYREGDGSQTITVIVSKKSFFYSIKIKSSQQLKIG